MSILNGIIRASRIPPRDVRCFHYLEAVPIGAHPDSEEAGILQHVNEIVAGSNEKLVLVDVEIHFHPLPYGLLVPAAASRRVLKLQPHVHREQILLVAGLSEYCQFEGDVCMVYKNHHAWTFGRPESSIEKCRAFPQMNINSRTG